MNKQYIIEKTYNGFIIKFDHIKIVHSLWFQLPYQSQNIRIAKTLVEVVRIIKNDLQKQEIKREIGEQVELREGDVFPSVEGVDDKDVEFKAK